MSAVGEDYLPESEILGQIKSASITMIIRAFRINFGNKSSLIFAGQDTSAHVLCRLLHQLIVNPEAQTTLREEVMSARQDNNGAALDYDTLMGLPYLDAIYRETLRVHTPVPILPRMLVSTLPVTISEDPDLLLHQSIEGRGITSCLAYHLI